MSTFEEIEELAVQRALEQHRPLLHIFTLLDYSQYCCILQHLRQRHLSYSRKSLAWEETDMVLLYALTDAVVWSFTQTSGSKDEQDIIPQQYILPKKPECRGKKFRKLITRLNLLWELAFEAVENREQESEAVALVKLLQDCKTRLGHSLMPKALDETVYCATTCLRAIKHKTDAPYIPKQSMSKPKSSTPCHTTIEPEKVTTPSTKKTPPLLPSSNTPNIPKPERKSNDLVSSVKTVKPETVLSSKISQAPSVPPSCHLNKENPNRAPAVQSPAQPLSPRKPMSVNHVNSMPLKNALASKVAEKPSVPLPSTSPPAVSNKPDKHINDFFLPLKRPCDAERELDPKHVQPLKRPCDAESKLDPKRAKMENCKRMPDGKVDAFSFLMHKKK